MVAECGSLSGLSAKFSGQQWRWNWGYPRHYQPAGLLGLSVKECVGLEDAEAGIESINAAGMFSVGVGTKEAMKEADYAVENTSQLKLETILEKASAS